MAKKSRRLKDHDVPDERLITGEISNVSPEEIKKLCKGVTEPRKIAYLVALSQLGNRSRAAKKAGVTSMGAWLWRQDDPLFAEAYARAMIMASELMESEAYRRAAEGVLKPVFHQGRCVGAVREYSDTLLIFALKGSMPDKYADRQKVQVTDIVGRLRAGRERALGRKKRDGDDG